MFGEQRCDAAIPIRDVIRDAGNGNRVEAVGYAHEHCVGERNEDRIAEQAAIVAAGRTDAVHGRARPDGRATARVSCAASRARTA